MKEMVKKICYWCEWENITTGGCIHCENREGYQGDADALGGENCPGFEKYLVKKYGHMHYDYLAQECDITLIRLLRSEEIDERMMLVDKTVTQKLHDMMEAALEKHPAPPIEDILERAGYIENLKKSFEEILLPEYVYNEFAFPAIFKRPSERD